MFRLKRTVTIERLVEGEALSRVVRDLQPVHIDTERMDRALAGERTLVPNGLSVEEICQFIDHVAKDVK